MVNYDEDEGDNERSTLLNPEQGRLTLSKNSVDSRPNGQGVLRAQKEQGPEDS